MKTNTKSEKIGEMLILSQVALYGLSPLLINHAIKTIDPLLFLALNTLLSGIPLCYILFTKQRQELKNKIALKEILIMTLLNVIIAPILIYFGTKYTSGINTALLLQTEVFFTFLICGFFFNEKITRQKIIGATVIIIGSIAIIYRENFQFNIGDILIMAGTAFFPFGNIYCKKALSKVSTTTVLFIRAIIGGIVLSILSLIFEKPFAEMKTDFLPNLHFLLINSILILIIAKIMWFEGLKRIEISKAVTIGISYPAFSLIFAALFFQEIPNIQQIIGFITIFVGVYLIIRKSPVIQEFEKTETLK